MLPIRMTQPAKPLSPAFAKLTGLLSAEAGNGYAELGQRFGMSEANLKVTVHRLRRRYRELLREEHPNIAKVFERPSRELRDRQNSPRAGGLSA